MGMGARLIDGIRIVLETERYVVIDKPAGVLSVPGKGEDKQTSCVSWVRGRFPRASGPIVVHRLDMDTSGLLVLALDEASQRELSRQFEARLTSKAYVALVDGHVREEAGEIRVPLRPDYSNRPYQLVDLTHDKPAITRWRVLTYEGDRTRLRLELETGRTHQLRVHCAWIGHPILGDVLYGEAHSAERLMLHAAELSFADPTTGSRVEARAAATF